MHKHPRDVARALLQLCKINPREANELTIEENFPGGTSEDEIRHYFGRKLELIGTSRPELLSANMFIRASGGFSGGKPFHYALYFDKKRTEQVAEMSWEHAQRLKPNSERPGRGRFTG